ncbi:MAG: tRNA pseudouridine(38-40) synthase TruA [Prevotella sp.]|nr:tRNA pseudouridine(38-40) synthase TruA [Prevotella sp.]
MSRYFIYMKYDGTGYHGWQVQPNSVTVQEELQKVLSVLLREDVQVAGAGRTDTGVHARMMVSHFDTTQKVDNAQLAYKLNRMLPKDISVDKVVPVDNDKHARFSALSRTYHYYVHLHKDPFLRAYSYELPYIIDFTKMNEAAELLLRYNDFSSFCKSNSDAKTMLCNVTVARWVRDSENAWHFEITANRFLRNMVRAIVGTLLDVGRGRIDIDTFKKIVVGGNRSDAGESVPGNALFLENIEYDMI